MTDIDVDRLAKDLQSAWDNRDLGDLQEIITALRDPGSFGLDYRAAPEDRP